MKHTLFWIIFGAALVVTAACVKSGLWLWAGVDTAVLIAALVVQARVHQWRLHTRCWLRERELRLLDWEIDDTDDEMLTERHVRHDQAKFRERLDWLNKLHARRKDLCNEIVALKLHLDEEPEPMDFVSAWSDPQELTPRGADAEVRRIRSL